MVSSVSVELFKRLFTNGAGFLGRFPPSFALHVGNRQCGAGVVHNGG
jgi:hypothetical protein